MDKKNKYVVGTERRTMAKALWFMHGQMYRYRPYSTVLPVLACLSRVGQSLLLVLLPRFVLDAVWEGKPLDGQSALGIMVLGIGLSVAAVLHLISSNEVGKCAQTLVFRKLNPLWERKMLRMEYAVLLSGNGKTCAEKARQAICSPNWGIAVLWNKETALLEAVSGLAVYCAIVGMLHPLALVFLGLCFLVELLWGVWMENRKQGLKEEKARVDRQLHYMAYGTRGMEEAKDIRVFSMEAMLRQITRKVIRDKNKVETKVQRWQFARMGMTALLIAFRDGAVYLYLIDRFLHTDMSIGDFSLYFAVVTGVGMWLTSLAGTVSECWEAAHYAKDLYEFLGLPEVQERKAEETGSEAEEGKAEETVTEVEERKAEETGSEAEEKKVEQAGIEVKEIKEEESGTEEAEETETWSGKAERERHWMHGYNSGSIGFVWENVSFSYGVWEDGKERKIPIFQEFNLQIKAGERLAVVGVNGAGKSTLVKLLCGLLQPDQGSIYINGTDSRIIPRWDYYSLFSAVFQHSRQLPVSVAENVMLNVRKEQEETAMWDCLEKAGLLEKVRSLPEKEKTCLVRQVAEEGTELSGGQVQRLLLARALYKDAPVLILDEPTAALDPLAESAIYEKYSSLTQGKTSLFISHRLASTRFCDRILFLEQGRVVESGSHEELMELGGKYAAMFQVQSKYYAKNE